MCRLKAADELACLGERQRAAARADPEPGGQVRSRIKGNWHISSLGHWLYGFDN
jgi:hypothetical protein